MNTNRLLFFVILLSIGLSSCKTSVPDASVEVDLTLAGNPIEPYIYGQFIEHLGKCINGGIWAEMVEDRKFYYPITPVFDPFGTDSSTFWGAGPYQFVDASPWEIIGRAGHVGMDSIRPYVGRYAVEINVPGDGSKAGVQQHGLGTILDKRYTGRIVLSGDGSVLPIKIGMASGQISTIVAEINVITPEFQSVPFEFDAPFGGESVSLSIYSEGKGTFQIGTLSLMPADHMNGWRKDVVDLMKQLNSPVYRWPGGNFVSGYNWRDGVGERDKRPPRKNPAWTGVEPNDVGIHEYMELMELLNAEAFIAVNTGLGTVAEVAEEVEYINGSTDTEWGEVRAQNGHPEPYGVKWWAVGNEMFGSWQLGHMPLSEYVKKHDLMADAIWKIDPDAKLIGVGAIGEWSKTMLQESADKMNLISEHIYCRELDSIPEHIAQIANSIKAVADAHRQYMSDIPGLAAHHIPIAMDEWNYWYGDYIFGELGVRYHQKDALGIAKGLHEYFRNSDLFFMANYAQTVNVIGCIKTTTTSSGFASTALPLILYRNHFESIPLQLDRQFEDLDVSVAISPGKDKITIAVVNSDPGSKEVAFDFGNVELSKSGTLWTIQNNDPEAYNEPGKPPAIEIVESGVTLKQNRITVPGYGIVMVALDIIQN